ncbi:hypothetical protein [Actinoplanes sp. NPDC051494]|uniref:hypothetical protein n=1 Tax=Actinoplanes sp. NPDC051494 TaxID=3363907 RepID=UPI0037A4CF54
MRSRPLPRALPAVAAALLSAGLVACGGSSAAEPPAASGSASPAADAGGTDARVGLAAHAALALDRHFTALYTVDVPGETQRSVMATSAADGTWRVDIPGGALGGTADVAIAEVEAGVFQCAIPSVTNPTLTSTCVKVAEKDERIPKKYDPRIERVFQQWLPVFTDRQSALSVTTAQPLAGSSGTCYSIDSIAASLSAVVDVGIYCYADDGLLTAARVKFATITIAGAPAAAPATIDLPGPVSGGEPMGMASPPPPPPPVEPSIDPSLPPAAPSTAPSA